MKIYDPVHGFIHFNELESALIDTEVFQRLRYIHQLGVTYVVYPGGTHTRFEHSLGTMHLATQIFEQVSKEEDRSYWRQILRLAALCHDLGHLPFSHVAEKRLLGTYGHEEWTLKMIESSYLQPIWEAANRQFPKMPIVEHVGKLALGPEKFHFLHPDLPFTPLEKVYSEIITGNFFGSDRIDYLLRDASATGLSYGLFDYMQLIEMLVLLPDKKEELVLGVEESGIASCEALLLARHFMQRRVYQYASAKAHSFHMARFMEEVYQDPSYRNSVKQYIKMSEFDVLAKMEKARKDKQHPGHLDAVCFSDRKQRFQAIALPQSIDASFLANYRKTSSVPSSHIHWDLGEKSSMHSPKGHALTRRLDLPILLKNAQIRSARQFSAIQIPPTEKNWLYLSPQYTFAL